MKKRMGFVATVLLQLMLLAGCGPIGEKQTSMSVIYGVLAVIALLFLLCYCVIIKKKSSFFLLLFSAIAVVNVGYFALAISSTVEEALLANRIAYLGSVFLPLSVLMIIVETCHLCYKKWVLYVLVALGICMFLITATPGYLDIYYQDAWLETMNGITVLRKVYGPWHSTYLYYLIAYYLAIFAALIHSIVLKRLQSRAHAIAVVGMAVINLGVWLVEQLLNLNFEFLAVSYVISEVSLLLFAYVHEEFERLKERASAAAVTEEAAVPAQEERSPSAAEYLCSQLPLLTPTERTIYEYYLENKTTREIMALLNIKENTLKYHNKNLYSKLGVSSRKELMQIARGEQQGK